MAKIALAVAGVAAGIAVGYFTGNPELGFAVFGAIEAADNLLFPKPGPHLGDNTISISTNGAPIPFGYGLYRLGGNIIWCPGMTQTSTQTSNKGGSSSTTTNYKVSFAAAFGEGPGTIKRIWGDSKLIYDANPITSGEIIDRGLWANTTLYNRADKVSYLGTHYVAVIENQNVEPDTSGSWMLASLVGNSSKYPAPALYSGSQTQTANALIQGSQGAANTPAFRHLIYAVWDDFPLADFGNRLPNIRAEIDFGNNSLTGMITDICERAGLSASQVVSNVGSGIPGSTATYGIIGLCGCFTDGEGHVIEPVWFGDLGEAIVPTGAVGLQIGVNDDMFADNTGSFGITVQNVTKGTSWTGTIAGTAMPWDPTINPAYPFGIDDGTAPVAVPLTVSAGDLVKVTWNSGTVKFNAGSAAYDGNGGGESINTGSTGQLFPAHYMANSFAMGYLISRPTAAKDALKPLCDAFFFDIVESGGALKAVPRGGSSVMTIPESDLGLESDKKKIEADMMQEQDLPREVQVIFPDQVLDYQQNKQSKLRELATVLSRNQMIIQIPVVLSVDQAAQIAEKKLYLSYLERKNFQFNTWKAVYLQLDPADVFQFVYNGITYQARLTSSSAGAGWTLEIKAVSEDSDNYTSLSVGAQAVGFQPSGGQPVIVPTTFYLFDIPLLRDSDANPGGTGFYFCMYGPSGWPGGVLYESPDDTSIDFALESHSSIRTNTGTATGTLGAPVSPWALDAVNTITVNFNPEASFSNQTQATLLATGLNALLVGKEILQFETAVQNVDGSWTFSNLLRGRRGTDWAVGSHGASELVVDLSSGGMTRVAVTNLAIGQTRYYRGVSIGDTVADVASKTLDLAAVDLKPYSPVAIGGSADGAGNITILWLRRTRFGGAYGTGSEALIDGVGGPVNENTEQFAIDIYNGASVVRTITCYTNTAVYTAAQQVADFGSVQATVTVKIYQISATVGRGYAGSGTVPGTTDAVAESTVKQPGFYVNGA